MNEKPFKVVYGNYLEPVNFSIKYKLKKLNVIAQRFTQKCEIFTLCMSQCIAALPYLSQRCGINRKFLYSALSSPWDHSKCFALHPLADLFIQYQLNFTLHPLADLFIQYQLNFTLHPLATCSSNTSSTLHFTPWQTPYQLNFTLHPLADLFIQYQLNFSGTHTAVTVYPPSCLCRGTRL